MEVLTPHDTRMYSVHALQTTGAYSVRFFGLRIRLPPSSRPPTAVRFLQTTDRYRSGLLGPVPIPTGTGTGRVACEAARLRQRIAERDTV